MSLPNKSNEGVLLECQGCGKTVVLPYTDQTHERVRIDIPEFEGWTAPPCRCPDCGPDMPADLLRVLGDPTITVPRDHEVKMPDGRSIFEHIHEWQNIQPSTPSADLS